MTPGRDDDALSWDGDDDPTLDIGATASVAADETAGTDAAAPATTSALPEGYTAVGKGSEDVGPASEPETQPAAAESTTERQAMGNAALVGIGILAGVYLLLSIGWLLGAARLQLVAQLFLEPAAFQVTLWLAVLALPLWFVTVLWFTRGGRAWVRFVLLIAGAVLLIPWPFVLAGAAL
ncbi:DNA polymerase III subunit gamma/tau [Microbacterium sp. SS28]|uniref:DNA polymerase III subunit gamma/tau n=1 Tax=Microbacterium sp. SS28 TaxID=2919948 RepID=UPI001FA9571E|nr:DNA polymerase III subunit gamma/tau [Microbacterium sp. SS28]